MPHPSLTRAEYVKATRRAITHPAGLLATLPARLTEYDRGGCPGVEHFPAVVDATGVDTIRLGAHLDAPTYLLTVAQALWPGKMN